MKKYIYQLLCSLFIGGTMVACAEDYMTLTIISCHQVIDIK